MLEPVLEPLPPGNLTLALCWVSFEMGPRTSTGTGAGVGERSVSMSGVSVMADVQAASSLWQESVRDLSLCLESA